MSEARSSIDLSEFFNDDDSEGHRFVDFIKKRRGRVRKQKYLFMDCETDRLSFDVQLEKLPTPQVRTDSDARKKNGNETVGNENNQAHQNADNEKLSSGAIIADNSGFSKAPIPPLNTEDEIEHSNRCPNRSPRSSFSNLRRSNGAIVPSDRLRRISIKNSAKKLTAGRRTLLHEFESTIEGTNFDPQVCSTPISQPEQNIPTPSLNTGENPEIENVVPNTAKNKITNESCCGHTDTLIRTLQRKDDELKNYLESILDKTLTKLEDRSKAINENSKDKTKDDRTKTSTYSKRTFTIAKGSTPGQLVLTPDKSSGNLESQNSKTQTSISRSINTRGNLRSPHYSQDSGKLDGHNPACPSFSKQRDKSLPKDENSNNDVPNSPHNTNLSIFFSTQNEIPETQPRANNGNNTIIIQSSMDAVIIPFNQAVSKVSKDKTDFNIDKNKQVENNSAIQTTSLQEAEDNLRLKDILTDDEEGNHKSILKSAEKNSEMPLNLALSSCNLRKRRLRKRISSKQKIQVDNSLQQCTESETDMPPPAHSDRPISTDICKPLNKAPGIPLNGEEYAQELARMSNYEILDLRKRNSMGQIYLITGRKSMRSQEEVSRKTNQLDGQIEKELLKRGLEEEIENHSCQTEPRNDIIEVLPAPSNFQDSLVTINDYSLVNEKSSDRVKFISNDTKQRRGRKKKIPEILKQYLEVSKKYSKQSRPRNLTKRSLYNSQDSNKSNEHVILEEGINASENQTNTRTKILNSLTTPKVVSLPPPINSSTEMQNSNANLFENLTLPPPPPGFESDSEISSNNNINPYTTNETLQVKAAVTTNEISKTAHCENNDDNIFKKPVKTAPRRKITKTKGTTKKSADDNQQSINSSADIIPGGSLRRSKRGQVQRQPPPYLEILYQQVLRKQEKRFEYEERKRKLEMKKLREIERNEVKAAKSIKSKNSKSSRREYSSLEVWHCNEDSGDRNMDAVKNTRKHAKTKSKSSDKKKKNSSSRDMNAEKNSKNKSEVHRNNTEIVPSNGNINCRHLTFSSAPPIEYINNMFDQFKNSLATTETDRASTTKNFPPQQKTKPLRIRVRRVKSTETTPVAENSSVSSTSINSSNELVSWLKNMRQTEIADEPMQIFKKMRISAASNLCFTEIQGVEYAFYDTEEKASYGYLRFKPRQTKPPKRAKRYQLHFINFIGKFRVIVNNDESLLGMGDMVIISKTAYYSIENITDDIGVLLVLKK